MKYYLFLAYLFLSVNTSAQNLDELYQLRSKVQESILQLRTQLDTLEKQMYLIEMEIHKQNGGTVEGIPVPEPSKPVQYSSPSSSLPNAKPQSTQYNFPASQHQSSQPIRSTASPKSRSNQLHTKPSVTTTKQNKKRKSRYRTTSVRCAATTQKGTRCKRMVRGGMYCWQH